MFISKLSGKKIGNDCNALYAMLNDYYKSTSIVENADKIYFFTDILEHTTYHRYINILRGKSLNFGYIHGVNLEKNIRQIYNEMNGK